MQTLREWLVRLLATLRPRRSDADLEEELRLHTQLAAEQAERRGGGVEEAQRQARLRVGAAAQTMESLRDQRGLVWLTDIGRDLGYALRSLSRSKSFTAAAVLSLALGIGATAGIFSLVDQVLLRPLPVRDADRLVQLEWVWRGGQVGTSWGSGSPLSYPACQDLGRQGHVFDGVFCRAQFSPTLSAGGPPEPVMGEVVSGSYFQVLGIQPALGRLIAPSDNQARGAHPVVVLSYSYWTDRLGAAPDVIGRQVLVNNEPMTVIGVAPAGFSGVDLDIIPVVWLPAMMTPPGMLDGRDIFDRRVYWMQTFGRLRAGVDLHAAQQQLEPWARSVLETTAREDDFPADEVQRARFLDSTVEVFRAVRPTSNLRLRFSRPLQILLGGTLLLLLLAALNVAGLHLARGAARTRELTTRMALGASRGRVARQLVVESAVITAAGAVLGIAAAPLMARALRSFVPAGANLDAGVDARVLLFGVLVTGVTGVLCGLAPILHVSRLQLSAALNDRSAISGGVRLRKLLVTGQLAFAVVLLLLAGLFVQTLTRLQAKGPGFATERLLLFGVDPTSIGFDYEQSEQAMREVFRRVQQLPDVEQVSLANTRVLNLGSQTGTYGIDDAGTRLVTDRDVYRLRVTPGFFTTLGARVIDGRDFDQRDVRPPGEPPHGFLTAIVNETFARRYFGARSPVGARLGPTRPGADATIEIIGVVREMPRRTLRDSDIDQVFLNYWDNQSDNGAFYVRTRHEPTSAYAAIRSAVASVDPRLPVSGLTTFDDHLARSLSNERALASLSTAFGVIALTICLVGVYGVMAFVAARRTQEIGVRLAFGASRRTGMWVVGREALLMVGAGLILAVPLALGLRRLVELESQLFGIDPFDGPTLATVGGGLTAIALAAAALPAWRAVAMPPMLAIRDQPESMWQVTRQSVQRVVRDLTKPRDTSSLASAALIAEVGVLLNGASSFGEAIHAALDTLRERVGARTIALLEKAEDGYRDERWTIPASGVLINRLAHYPHPMLLGAEDIAAWQRWAAEARPQHLDEIDTLERFGVRLAVPLRTTAGIAGVLLLDAPTDRAGFTLADAQVLREAADVFALLLVNARLSVRALEQEKLRRDVALAAAVQRRLLPPEPPRPAGIGLAAFTQPARSIGGDYYDFVELSGDRLGIAIADVAGKGVPAALLMSVVQASLRVLTDGDIDCAQLAAKMNRFLARSTAANGYATFFYAQLEPRAGRLRYVNAGHNPPMLARRTAAGVEIQELSTGGTVLGLFGHAGYDSADVDLLPGDALIAFTDGVTEARSLDGDEFGEDRVRALLGERLGASADALAATLAERVRAWSAGAEQHDDITFVVATIDQSPTPPDLPI